MSWHSQHMEDYQYVHPKWPDNSSLRISGCIFKAHVRYWKARDAVAKMLYVLMFQDVPMFVSGAVIPRLELCTTVTLSVRVISNRAQRRPYASRRAHAQEREARWDSHHRNEHFSQRIKNLAQSLWLRGRGLEGDPATRTTFSV